MTIQKFTRHPIVSISAVCLGILCGMYAKTAARFLSNIGDIFLLLLNMCSLPILVTSIISSVGMVIVGKNRNGEGIRVRRMVGYYAAACLIVEVLAAVVCSIIRPGVLSIETQDALGSVLMNYELGREDVQHAGLSLWEIIKNMIPKNVFESLANGNTFQVLFTSLAVGVAAGVAERNKEKYQIKTSVLDLCAALFKIMTSVLSAFMYFLPLGLFAMTASQIAVMGVDAIQSMARYVVCIYIICAVVFIICAVAFTIKLHISFGNAIAGLKDSMLLAFASRSSLAAMPVAMDNLVGLGLNEAQVHVIMPLGTVIARFSMMILYVSGMMFASQLYGIPLSPLQLAEGLFLCALASIAGVGSPMMVSLSLFSLIFVPLGIPYTAVITLHMLVIIAVDPVLTMENTHINSTLTVFLGGVSKKI